jgi:uncharacterized phage protein (TIGR02216 family)
VLHLALCRLRWDPETVWRATPREIALALAPPLQSAPDLADLHRLMTTYPDL